MTLRRDRFVRAVSRMYDQLDIEEFQVADTGQSFFALYEQVESDPLNTSDGKRTFEAGEISFEVADFAPSQLKDGYKLYRVEEGTYWLVDGNPSDDGLAGEAIVRITRQVRSRIGAR